uniref:Uncharacterized protein n=1 Tax=Globisporangium ultimum (strain ATCC 200006 / CBS 805.95 / DAOM BR144) TaxID=431595 RepID=K3WPR0_GLOUD
MWKTCAIGALVACALNGIATAIRPGDQTCALSASNQCAVSAIEPSTLDGSVLIYPGGKTRCAFDDFTDVKGNFSTNKTYFFQVFPNKDQDKKKLLLFFQGGGACTGEDTCSFSLQCSLGKSATFNPNAVASSSGILNRTNTDNLFKDWNIVHIPYCTGDLHVGNAERQTSDSGFAQFLGQPQCIGQKMVTHMAGYENTMSALKWALANYPNPEHLIVGGASAGSLAAQAVSALVADLWSVKDSSIRYSVLADSYVGVLPEEKKPSGETLDYYGACDVDLKVPAGIESLCKAKTLTVVQLMSSLLQATSFSDWLFIDSKADKTQRYFYQLVKDGIAGYPFPNLISGADFFADMTTMINAYRTVSSRISTFFVEGERHVFLTSEDYTTVLSDTGDVLGAFLKKWLLPHDDPSVAPTPAPTSGNPSPAPAAPSTTPSTTPAVMPSVVPTATPSVRPSC